jgi:hypothetical protein
MIIFLETVESNMYMVEAIDVYHEWNLVCMHKPDCQKLLLFTAKSRVHTNTSCLEAHAGFFRLLMKGIFDVLICNIC